MAEFISIERNGMRMELFDRLKGGGLGAVVARGTVGSLIIKSAGLLLVFGAHLLLTRLLGAGGYGAYSLVISWLSVLAVFAKLGQVPVALRFVAAYNTSGDWSSLRGLLLRSSQLLGGASAGAGLALAAVVLWLGGRLDSELRRAFLIGCLALPLMCLLPMREAVLQGLKKIVLSQAASRLILPVCLAAFAALRALAGRRHFDGADAVWCTLLAYAVCLVFSSIWQRKALPGEVRQSRPAFHTRQWLTVGLGMLFVTGQFLVLNRIDIMMLGALSGKAGAGIYAVAARVSWLVTFFLEAVSMIAAPLISELYTGKRMAELQRMTYHAVLASTIFATAVCLVLLAFGRFFLGLFGPEFSAGYTALGVLSFAQLINAVTGPSGFLLTMTGHENSYSRILFFALLLNILLNYLLIPRYGMNGAAVATALANILLNAWSVILIRRRLGIWSLCGAGGRSK